VRARGRNEMNYRDWLIDLIRDYLEDTEAHATEHLEESKRVLDDLLLYLDARGE